MSNFAQYSLCLYRHIRPDTNEVFYVGIGNENRPKSLSSRSKLWKNVVNKNNGEYKIDIMLEDLELEYAKEKEKEFIELYGRKNLGTGTLVNLTDGGEGSYGRKTSKETIEKIRQGNLGKSATKKHILALSKPIYQLTIKGKILKKFPSIREAERQTGLSNRSISSVCTGYKGARMYNGYSWCFEENVVNTISELKNNPIRTDSRVKVIQYTLDGKLIKEWMSISDAHRELGLHTPSISAACRGKRKTAGGYIWKYKK